MSCCISTSRSLHPELISGPEVLSFQEGGNSKTMIRMMSGHRGSRRVPSPSKPFLEAKIDLSRESHRLFVEGSRMPLKVKPCTPRECLKVFLNGLEDVKDKSKELNTLINSTKRLMEKFAGNKAVTVVDVQGIVNLLLVSLQSASAPQIVGNVSVSVESLSRHKIFEYLVVTIQRLHSV